MLYSTLHDVHKPEKNGILCPVHLAVKIEAYARHAFALSGALQPLDHRPEFDRLFRSPYQDTLIDIGRNILKYMLPEGVLLGEAGELKDRIGTPDQFKRDVLYHLSREDASKEIEASSRLINVDDPDDLRSIAIFALAEPEAFCVR